jgi:MFS transporter, DHA3 family, macrolide efflux protein
MTETSKVRNRSDQKEASFMDLMSIRNYRFLIFGQFVSALGDGVYALALIWAMKLLTGSAVQMSFVLAADIIPTILFGIFAGVLVDRGNQKKFMVLADIFRGLVVFCLVLLFWTNLLMPWMLILSAAIISSFGAFFSPAKTVAVRTIVPETLIHRAQSISSTIQTIVGLVAPAVAGVLLLLSIPSAFLFNSVTFFISFLFIALIREKQLTTKHPEKLNAKMFVTDLKTGFKTIITVPILRGLIIYLVLINFMFAPVEVLFPVYVHNPSQLAAIEIAFFIGILVGSISFNLFNKCRKVVPMVVGILLILLSFGILSFMNSFIIALVLVSIAGVGSPLASIALQSLFMVKVPREVLGRSQSTMRVMLESTKPVSLLLTGVLLVQFSVSNLFLGISIFGAMVVLLMVLNPVIRKAN